MPTAVREFWYPLMTNPGIPPLPPPAVPVDCAQQAPIEVVLAHAHGISPREQCAQPFGQLPQSSLIPRGRDAKGNLLPQMLGETQL